MGQGTESCGGYEVEYDPYAFYESDGFESWTQRDGSSIRVGEMTSSHIRNTIRICENAKRMETFTGEQEKWDEWIETFETELSNRGELRFDVKTPAYYDSPDVVQPTRGSKIEMICHCGQEYSPRKADLKRGYAKSCSKKCAAIKRDFGRPNPKGKDGRSYKDIIQSLKENK
ncbi:hypothetical protein Va1_072 [Vibrio phage Va1]|nr:hypothetical protein Va1_072 [Vibrio phage Va1]